MLRPVHCDVHYGPTPQPFHTYKAYDTFENRSFERLLKPVIVYLQCMLRDIHCYFYALRLKSGGIRYPHSKKWGYAYSRTPR